MPAIDQSKRRDARGAAKLQNVIEVYERALGLVVDFSDPDRLTYKFTCIDEKDVSKEHCVVIRRREADSKSFECKFRPCHTLCSLTVLEFCYGLF